MKIITYNLFLKTHIFKELKLKNIYFTLNNINIMLIFDKSFFKFLN